MKLKKTVRILMIAGGVLLLAACSGMRHGGGTPSGAADYGYGSGSSGQAMTQARGIGEGERFPDAAGGRVARNTRVYYFDFDKSAIRDEYRPAILANADWLVAHPNRRIILEGHTDPRGSREYNIALGERRAESVAALMKTRGVNPAQIRVVSYGEEKPAVPGYTESDYQKDRRAVIVIMTG